MTDCTLSDDGWARVFESTTQPVRKIYTGQSTVWELGGTFIHAYGRPSMSLNDWSVFSRYFIPGAPETTFATLLEDFGGKYLSFAEVHGKHSDRQLVDFISRVLMPYPQLHSFAASTLKLIRRYRKLLPYRLIKSNIEPDIELVHHAVSGYNVIRCSHKYYAIQQSEGAFIPEKAKSGGYSSCFFGNTADEVLRQIVNVDKEIKQQASNNSNQS